MVNNRVFTVKFIEGYRQADRDAFENEFDLTLFEEAVTGYIDYIIPQNEDYIEICNDIIIQEIVDYFSIAIYIETCFEPNDDDLIEQWYLDAIDVYDAWDLAKGKKEVIVAVLDTGVDWDYEEFGPVNDDYDNIYHNPGEDTWIPWNDPDGGNGFDGIDNYSFVDDWKGWNYTSQYAVNWDNDTRHDIGDTDRHGSRVAGIISAKTNNNNDIAGIAGGNIENGEEGVSCMPVKIGYNNYIELVTLDNAIHYATSMGAKVINLSIGWPDWGGIYPNLFESVNEALESSYNDGVFIAGAAGNTGEDDIIWPALNDYVFSVNASNPNDQLMVNLVPGGVSSSYGEGLEMAAPGENIWSIDGFTGSGTSYSSAMVSATAALMLSVNPNLLNSDIWDILIKTAEKVGGYNYQGYPDTWCLEFGYGRLNVCKAVSAALKYTEAEYITSTTTWNDPKLISNNVYISPQCTLTVKNTVRMGTYIDNNGIEQKAKIIVMRGEDNPGTQNDKSAGTLIIDGGKLTNLENCDDPDVLWGGVEVWGFGGTPNQSKSQLRQDGIYWQGKIILKNGAIIENAEIGVLLGKRTTVNGLDSFDDTRTGGILSVANNGDPLIQCAEFLNNKTSVRFQPYKNFIPNSNPIVYTDNLSAINNCFFDINTDYLGGDWGYEHIFLTGVKGVRIKGCIFENNKTSTHSGHGINALQAGFIVEAICNGNYLPPCPDNALDKCYFKKFTKAINLANGATYTLSVKNSIFEDNSNGVVMSTVSNAVVILNEFKIGYYTNDEGLGCLEKGVSYGIDMANCKGFSVEENMFSKYPGAPTGNYIGIRVNACPSASDNIYLNKFVGLSQGNLAQGTNRSVPEDDGTGVAYLCNQNINNSYDFYVGSNSRIKGKMGSLTSPSGNELTNPGISIMQFQNDGTQNVEYYYNVNEPTQWLTEYSAYVSPFWINYSNTCPSHYGGGGGGTGGRIVLTDEEVLQKEQEYYSGLNNYNNIEALYESLKDGGNTEQLQSEVATAWPSEMWVLRAELLGKSPHLSKEVLMTAADKTDVLPESVIFEIMAANPDELRKEDLISYLENKAQPLPGYMIEILRQVSNGVTYKTALKCQISAYHSQKVNAANDIIRSILNDTISDYNTLRNWLDNLGGYEADKQIIASYIHDSIYASALNLIQLLPSLYELSGDQLIEYNQYKSFTEWLIGLYQQNRTIYELDSIEIANLVNIAENGSGDTKYSARGILEFAYGYHYCDCPELPEIAGLKNSKIINDNGINNFGLLITAQPNPAKEWVAFNFRLPPGLNSATVKITDITSKVADVINLNGNIGQAVWDSRKVNPGVYFYTINAGNATKSDKIVIE
jgi:hypothetical protein